MKILVDTHTHSLASGHATTDTVTDLARAAAKAGLSTLGITEHCPAVLGATKDSYFLSYAHMPRNKFGVQLLLGVEADVLDETGKLGIRDEVMGAVDLVIASQHSPLFRPSHVERNTQAMVAAVRSGKIDIVGHPDDEKYPLDYERLVDACAECGVIVELNNASLAPGGYRGKHAAERDARLLQLCRKKGVYVAMGSDSHGAKGVGNLSHAKALLSALDFPQEFILNDKPDSLLAMLSARRRKK